MHVRNLFADDRAVSPVIGVILMVAITVILAAVIGTFVLGLGDQLGDNAPSASYSWDQDGTGSDAVVELEHRSGENFDASTVTATHNGSAEDVPQTDFRDTWGGGDGVVSAGSTVDFYNSTAGPDGDVDVDGLDTDSTLRIVWESPQGGTSSTLTTYTVG